MHSVRKFLILGLLLVLPVIVAAQGRGARNPPYFGDGAPQPHADRTTAPVLHALLGRRQSGVGGRRNRDGVETRFDQVVLS